MFDADRMLMLANIVMTIPVVAGFIMGNYFLAIVIARRRVIASSGENGIAKLAIRRAMRNETGFMVVHSILLVSAVVSIIGHEKNGYAITWRFYEWSFFGRMLIAIVLLVCAAMDLRERPKLAAELNKIKPGTQSALG